MTAVQSLDTMMTQNDQKHLEDIERLLNEMRGSDNDVPKGLSQRVLADAAHVQPMPVTGSRAAPFWQRWFGEFGGLPALGGLVAASCVGFWIGLSPPEGLGDPALWLLDGTAVGYEGIAEVSAFGWDLEEG